MNICLVYFISVTRENAMKLKDLFINTVLITVNKSHLIDQCVQNNFVILQLKNKVKSLFKMQNYCFLAFSPNIHFVVVMLFLVYSDSVCETTD